MFSTQRLRNTDISAVVLLLLKLGTTTASHTVRCVHTHRKYVYYGLSILRITGTWDLSSIRESCIFVFILKLTPGRKALPEKLTASQEAKKFPELYET
jgi:hypothetical protein